MDFIEEKSPENILIKILFNKWQFLAFDKKGKSIYADAEGRNLLHEIPKIVFVGKHFRIPRNYNRDYIFLKIRNRAIIVPYIDTRDKKKKYLFVPSDEPIDMVPVRMRQVDDVTILVKEIEVTFMPEHIVVDDSVTQNDIVIIKNRYKITELIHADFENNYRRIENLTAVNEDNINININTMSGNPVFLAGIHIKNMDLSKVNQLLLDFELSILDTEYIHHYIKSLIKKSESDPALEKHKAMLRELNYAYGFYLNLLKKNDAEIRKVIESCENIKWLAPLRTLILKAKSIQEHDIYIEYEAMVQQRKKALQAPPKAAVPPVKNSEAPADHGGPGPA